MVEASVLRSVRLSGSLTTSSRARSSGQSVYTSTTGPSAIAYVEPFILQNRNVAHALTQAYCWWGQNNVFSPYYGAYFVSEFLGTDGAKVAALDNGSSAIATYAVYSSANVPLRLLVVNSNFFNGTGARTSTAVQFTGLRTVSGTKQAKRLTAPNATSRTDQGAAVTIGGNGTFSSTCVAQGTQRTESVVVNGNALTVSVLASEALIVFL